MRIIRQARDPEVSLLQSAIDKIVTEAAKGGGAQSVGAPAKIGYRPGLEDPLVHQAAALAHLVDAGEAPPEKPPLTPTAAEGVGQVAAYCAGLALKLAKAIFLGDNDTIKRCRQELTDPFTTCDARYVEAAEQCAVYFDGLHGVIPYVQWQKLSDFVIEKRSDGAPVLPPDAVVGIIGDWGTGQERANQVLRKIKEKNPHVVIHLGDIYYAGVDHEVQRYFFDNWCRILALNPDVNRRVTAARPWTCSLAGNHDMYSGGAAYYKMIQQLGQPASFMCLRNEKWQLIGMDTGYNDHALDTKHFTSLQDTEAQWVVDKVKNAGGRRTVLLSHHQPFSANDSFQDEGPVNTELMKQVAPVLADVDLWIWGHEHDLVMFEEFKGVKRGRCVGHGAYPVGITELPSKPKHSEVPLVNAKLTRGSAFYDNGYALMTLDGAKATVQYFAVHEDGVTEEKIWTDEL
jgi:hypothetical protein